MTFRNRCLLFLAVAALTQGSPVRAIADDVMTERLQKMWSCKQIEVIPFDVTGSPEVQKIAEAFQKAARDNFGWFRDYVEKNQGGGPLPYHPNMGISEAEYKTFQKSIDSLELTPVGKPFPMRIIKDGDLVTFEPIGNEGEAAAGSIPASIRKIFTLLRFDLASTQAWIMRVELGEPKWVEGKNERLGAFKGFEWEVTDERILHFEELPEGTVVTNNSIRLLFSEKRQMMYGNFRIQTGDRDGVHTNANLDFWFKRK